MPIKDGADATREIRRHEWGSGTHVPVIGLSGLKDENYRCMESGMDAFVAKPDQRDVLIMIINRWIKKYENSIWRDVDYLPDTLDDNESSF